MPIAPGSSRRRGRWRLQLLRRQRDAGDGGAAHFRQIKAETAPARTGVEHAVAGPGQQLGGEMPFLGELGFVECQVGRFEIGAAVLLVGIEEQGIEPSVEIVVARDIVLRTLRGLNCCACLAR